MNSTERSYWEARSNGVSNFDLMTFSGAQSERDRNGAREATSGRKNARGEEETRKRHE